MVTSAQCRPGWNTWPHRVTPDSSKQPLSCVSLPLGYGSFKNPYPRVSTYMMRSRQSLLRAEDYLGNQGNQVRRSWSESVFWNSRSCGAYVLRNGCRRGPPEKWRSLENLGLGVTSKPSQPPDLIRYTQPLCPAFDSLHPPRVFCT